MTSRDAETSDDDQSVSEARQKLLRRIVEAIRTPGALLEQWMPLLCNAEYDHAGELRNQGFYILVIGLFDAVEEGESKLADMRHEALSLKSKSCSFYANLVEFYLDGIIDVLSIFTLEETAYLSEMRTQTVHGQLKSIHKDNRSFLLVEHQTVVRRRMPQDEYWRLYHGFKKGRAEHDASDELRRRFMYRPSFFWEVEGVLRLPDARTIIENDMAHHDLDERTVFLELGEGYWTVASERAKIGNVISPSTFRKSDDPTDGRTMDPAFP